MTDFPRETLAMALIGVMALAFTTTEDDMHKPFARYQAATLARHEPRNDREAHAEFCCNGNCTQDRTCPAIRHGQPAPARQTWRERIAAWIGRHLVDPIVRS